MEDKPRILLVDDEESLREALVDVFSNRGWDVEAFGDVASAAAAIDKAKNDGRQFDIAILDLLLPKTPTDGSAAELDELLCSKAEASAAVIHITAHAGNAGVLRHMDSVHSTEGWPTLIEKSPSDTFTERLITHVRRRLAERRIRAALAALTGSPEVGRYARRYRPDPQVASATNLTAQICADIRTYWDDLHPAFRQTLRNYFEFEPDNEKPPVNVYPR